jgi:hypothetical protein
MAEKLRPAVISLAREVIVWVIRRFCLEPLSDRRPVLSTTRSLILFAISVLLKNRANGPIYQKSAFSMDFVEQHRSGKDAMCLLIAPARTAS